MTSRTNGGIRSVIYGGTMSLFTLYIKPFSVVFACRTGAPNHIPYKNLPETLTL